MPRMTKAETARLQELLKTVQWTEEALEELTGFAAAEGLTFARGARFPCGGVARLAALPALAGLSFTSTTFSGEDLAALGQLSGLGGLVLEDCPIGDADLAILSQSRLPLVSLDMPGTRITDAALETIASAFPTLRFLVLSRTAVTDAGLHHLAGLSRLEVLWLDGTRVTDAGLPALGPAAKLTGMNLKQTAVTDAGRDAHFLAWLEARRGPNARLPDPAAVEESRTLLLEFFAAINEWEGGNRRKERAVRKDYTASCEMRGGRQQAVARIFEQFCTARHHDKPRDILDSSPHTYAGVEFLAEEQPTRNRIHIYAKQQRGTDSYYLFVMVRTLQGWRLDAKRWWGLGGWQRDYF